MTRQILKANQTCLKVAEKSAAPSTYLRVNAPTYMHARNASWVALHCIGCPLLFACGLLILGDVDVRCRPPYIAESEWPPAETAVDVMSTTPAGPATSLQNVYLTLKEQRITTDYSPFFSFSPFLFSFRFHIRSWYNGLFVYVRPCTGLWLWMHYFFTLNWIMWVWVLYNMLDKIFS
jgi:hypothetical protein